MNPLASYFPSTDYFGVYVKENFNEIHLGAIAWRKKLEGIPQEGDQFITNDLGCYIYFKYHNKQWCPYTKIPKELLATLYMTYPDVYTKLAKALKL